jgi:hypothetical protein
MKGRLTIIPAGTGAVSSKELAAAPRLEDLPGGVGGDIELVPGFIRYQGEPCAAFCDEDGKGKRMPVNQRATALWHAMLAPLKVNDYLVGPIVIVTGDRELLEEL